MPDPHVADPASEPRRARLRRELTNEIKRIARRQLAESGPGGVSWRGIAREVGMNPASLYTYFASLDELYTALILDSFRSLAATLEDASRVDPARSPADVLVACLTAYRRWASDRPGEFNLVFSDQLPGYAAPAGGPTVDAELAVLRPLVGAIAALGGFDADPARPELSDPAHVDAAIGLWATVHGLVALEVNHHLPLPDQPARFDRLVRAAVARLATELA